MLRRWLVRALCILFCATCLIAWPVSYWRSCGLRYTPSLNYAAHLLAGRINIARWEPFFDPPGWKFECFRPEPDFYSELDKKAKFQFLHFAYRSSETSWQLAIPLWLPALLSSLILLFAWRKTQAKSHAKGFPVEPVAPPNEQRPPQKSADVQAGDRLYHG